MKVCMITGHRYPSSLNEPLICGAHNGPFHLSRALTRQGAEVHIISPRAKDDKNYEILEDVHIHRYKGLPKLSGQTIEMSPSRQRLFLNLCKDMDILNATTPIPCEAFLAQKYNLPVIYTSHGTGVDFSKNLNMNPRDLIFKIGIYLISHNMLKITWKFSERIITVAERERENLIQNFNVSPHKIKTIFNGVDLSLYNPYVVVSELEAKYDLGDKKVIVYVGRISPEKGIDYLIDIFPQILEKYENARLLIVGVPVSSEKNYLDSVIRKIQSKKLGKYIRVLTDIPERDLAKFYKLGVASLNFSFGFDPCPNTILESMACAVPVISTDWPPRREFITDKVNGILVPEKDTHALKDAILSILSDDEFGKKLGENARETMEQRMNIDIMARSYLNIFNDLLNSNG